MFFIKTRAVRSGLAFFLAVLVAALLTIFGGTIPAGAATGDVLCASSNAGGEPANNTCLWSSISADGRYAVFGTEATNLGVNSGGNQQVYRKDISGGGVVCCSTTAGGEAGNAPSSYPSISADGRFVAFESYASNFGADPGGMRQVFRKDVSSGEVVCCSTNDAGEVSNSDVDGTLISPDGAHVGFDTLATNLGVPWGGFFQVYCRDLTEGVTRCASTNASGLAGDSPSNNASVSNGGRYVAFASYAGNLAGNPGGTQQSYRKDLSTGEVVMCSTTGNGEVGNDQSYHPRITPDGAFVAFDSQASNFGVNPGGESQAYRKDVSNGGLVCCTTNASGEVANIGSGADSITADGRYVSFTSGATNLGVKPGLYRQVFRKDVNTGEVVCCSTNASDQVSDSGSENSSISSDGLYVSFESGAGNLVANPGAYQQVYRKEMGAAPPTPPIQQTSRVWGTDSVGVTQPSNVWYLAEGCTGGSFETWILVQNPNNTPADIALTYMTPTGAVPGPSETLAPNSRKTYSVGNTVPGAWEVSTKVTCSNNTVIAERAEYWGNRREAHDSIGVSEPAKTWYLAEGCTAPGFTTWILVQNPNDSPTDVKLTYMTPSGPVDGPAETLVPNSRKTYNAGTTVPGTWEVSTKVEASAQVIAERSMYGGPGPWGTDSIGVSSAAPEWFLAEGCTAPTYETWVLVQNPNATPADIKLTFMTPSGAVDGPAETLAPNSRKTYNVGSTVPGAWEVSTKVNCSNNNVIAERAMYGKDRTWAHDSVGVPAPSKVWYLAEGSTGPGFETWVLVQNPGDSAAGVRITYMTPSGVVSGPAESLPAHSRKTYNVASTVSGAPEVSTMVTSDNGVVVERAMYGDPK